MAEVVGLGALISDSPDVAKIEREISKIRYAKPSEPDYTSEFYKKMRELTADKGLEIDALKAPAPTGNQLPHKNNHGPMLDFMAGESRREPDVPAWTPPEPRKWEAPRRSSRRSSISSESSSSSASSVAPSRPSQRWQAPSRRRESSDSESSSSESESGSEYDRPHIDNLDAALDDIEYGPTRKSADPRSTYSVEQMIEEIDILRMSLGELKVDTSKIPEVNPGMTHFEIRRIHRLLMHLFSEQQYASVFEDGLIIAATGIESIFDGSRAILGKFRLNYSGLANAYSMRLKQNPVAVKHMVTRTARQYGMNPSMLTAAQFFLPLVGTPLKNMNQGGVINNRHTQQSLGNIH